jgi:hypothetical protein
LARHLGLRESQVYKWNWDRRNLREKYIEGRLKSMELPNQIFKVTKIVKLDNHKEEEIDITTKVGYFKILKQNTLDII